MSLRTHRCEQELPFGIRVGALERRPLVHAKRAALIEHVNYRRCCVIMRRGYTLGAEWSSSIE